MKILLINTSDINGGAAIAAYRLMEALRKEDVEVRMLVNDKFSDNDNVISVNSSWLKRKINLFRFVWERLIIYAGSLFDRKNLFRVSIANTGTDISKFYEVRDADIIHLHWINQGFLSISDIKKLINLGKPIVWTMHDLWITNGIYHYPDENKLKGVNFEKIVFNRKKRLGLSKITFIGCSKWITERAEQSLLLKNARKEAISNTIDISTYKPLEKYIARKSFALSDDKIIILFAAARVSDTRKGISYFIESCNYLHKNYPELSSRIEIALMGSKAGELAALFPFPIHNLGYLTDVDKIVAAYSLADIYVISSLEDNLPNTIMEAMACGTPCVGFDTGGIPEMIEHKKNGYVAKYKSSIDLAEGFVWCINNNIETLSINAREKVINDYANDIIARKHIELYEKVKN